MTCYVQAFGKAQQKVQTMSGWLWLPPCISQQQSTKLCCFWIQENTVIHAGLCTCASSSVSKCHPSHCLLVARFVIENDDLKMSNYPVSAYQFAFSLQLHGTLRALVLKA